MVIYKLDNNVEETKTIEYRNLSRKKANNKSAMALSAASVCPSYSASVAGPLKAFWFASPIGLLRSPGHYHPRSGNNHAEILLVLSSFE